MQKTKLFKKLFPAFLVIIFITVIPTAYLFTSFFEDFYISKAKKHLKADTILFSYAVLETSKNDNNQKHLNNLINKIRKDKQIRFTLIDKTGNVIIDSYKNAKDMENHSNRDEIKTAFTGKPAFNTRYSSTQNHDNLYFAMPILNNTQVLRSAIPIDSLYSTLEQVYISIFITFTVIAGVAIFISYIISKRISNPIEGLQLAAAEYAKGNFTYPLPSSNISEIFKLKSFMQSMGKSLETQLKYVKEEKNKLEIILSNMSDGIIAIDNDKKIILINSAAKKILKLKNDTEQYIYEIIRDENFNSLINDTFKNKDITRKQIEFSVDKMILDVKGIFVENNNPLGAIIVLNNITKIANLENMRKNFASNVSHELKTPLTSIKGATDTLLSCDVDSETSIKFLKVIAKHSDRLNTIINDIMTISKLEDSVDKNSITMKQENLLDILITAMNICHDKAEEKGVEIEINCPEDLFCNLNAQMIEQAIINLVDNAVKYSPKNKNVNIIANLKEKKIEIRVTDQGCGISKKHIARLFERFYRVDPERSRDKGGTGLGLSITKHIVSAHNGNIEVLSNPYILTEFIIKIPV